MSYENYMSHVIYLSYVSCVSYASYVCKLHDLCNTTKSTIISRYFLVGKFCGNGIANHQKLSGDCAFPKN